MSSKTNEEAAATPTAAPEVEMPSAARVKRVEQALKSDEIIKERLGKKSVKISGRGGTSEHFTQEAVDVTNALIAAKKEPFTVLKKDIIATAMKVLNINSEAVAPSTEPAAPPTEKSEGKTAKNNSRSNAVDQTLSIVSLLLSAINIAKHSDSHSGADARRKRLEEIKDEYVSAANIKVS